MKDTIIKIIKFIGKFLFKVFKIVICLPLAVYKFSKTYDMNGFEEDMDYVRK